MKARHGGAEIHYRDVGLTPFGGHRVRRLVPSEWIDSRIRPG